MNVWCRRRKMLWKKTGFPHWFVLSVNFGCAISYYVSSASGLLCALVPRYFILLLYRFTLAYVENMWSHNRISLFWFGGETSELMECGVAFKKGKLVLRRRFVIRVSLHIFLYAQSCFGSALISRGLEFLMLAFYNSCLMCLYVYYYDSRLRLNEFKCPPIQTKFRTHIDKTCLCLLNLCSTRGWQRPQGLHNITSLMHTQSSIYPT